MVSPQTFLEVNSNMIPASEMPNSIYTSVSLFSQLLGEPPVAMSAKASLDGECRGMVNPMALAWGLETKTEYGL